MHRVSSYTPTQGLTQLSGTASTSPSAHACKNINSEPSLLLLCAVE
jgi:hypothetical protein